MTALTKEVLEYRLKARDYWYDNPHITRDECAKMFGIGRSVLSDLISQDPRYKNDPRSYGYKSRQKEAAKLARLKAQTKALEAKALEVESRTAKPKPKLEPVPAFNQELTEKFSKALKSDSETVKPEPNPAPEPVLTFNQDLAKKVLYLKNLQILFAKAINDVAEIVKNSDMPH
jgi:hypothetical protein